MNLEVKEVELQKCSFCGQKKPTFLICEEDKDELLNFQNEKAVSLKPEDYKHFMKTLYWSCNLFLGYLEEFDDSSIFPYHELEFLKKDLIRFVGIYKPTRKTKVEDKLQDIITDIYHSLVRIKSLELRIPKEKHLFQVFAVFFLNFSSTIRILSKNS
jgi:hypothetical protein